MDNWKRNENKSTSSHREALDVRFNPSATGATAGVALPGRLGVLASGETRVKTELPDIKRRQCNRVKMSPCPTKQNVHVYKR